MNNDNKVKTAIAGLNCWASYATVQTCNNLCVFTRVAGVIFIG